MADATIFDFLQILVQVGTVVGAAVWVVGRINSRCDAIELKVDGQSKQIKQNRVRIRRNRFRIVKLEQRPEHGNA